MDINNSSNYLSEKSEQWIEDNLELVHKAGDDKDWFIKLISELENDKELKGNDKILIYDDIRRNYWHDEHRFGINYTGSAFFGGVFERQKFEQRFCLEVLDLPNYFEKDPYFIFIIIF